MSETAVSMSIIVDSSVWSLALRRKTPPDSSPAVTILQNLITDFLICAVAHRRGYSILSTDNDFQNFLVHIPIILLPVER